MRTMVNGLLPSISVDLGISKGESSPDLHWGPVKREVTDIPNMTKVRPLFTLSHRGSTDRVQVNFVF